MSRRLFMALLSALGILGDLAGSRVRAEEVPPRIVHHPSDVVVKIGNPATLSCRAEGRPQPSIEWLRNGHPLVMDKYDSQSQPMVLLEGSLFFLSVAGGRRGQSHEGVYTCVAKNNAGKATSRNASLYIAVLQEEFSVQPSDVEVAEGEVAVLNCGPPVGHPEPNVIWRKDGVPINMTDHHYIQVNGKLIIDPTEKNHSGVYVCVAANTVGIKESRAARLSVLAKPVLVLTPEDVSVRAGGSAQFNCQAKGEPPPTVVWSREQGPLPNGRYLVNPDQSLEIHYVTGQDAGKYTCTAVNDVGVITANAQLLVEQTVSSTQKDLHRELSTLRVVLENVTVMASASNLSQVEWKLQSLPVQPHYLDGFEVLYHSLLPASSDWAAKRVMASNFHTQVGPLKRGYKYEFKVRPYSSNLYGRESNTRHLRVPEMVPSASPLAVTIMVDQELNNTIHLSWKPPPQEAFNGIIRGYQVQCLDSERQQYQNWTVDSDHYILDISALTPGKQYWITVAAINGAGIGTPSDPRGFFIESKKDGLPLSDNQDRDLSKVLVLLRDPVLIGTIGALVWCVLMATAVYLFRRHYRTGNMGTGLSKVKGLHRLASEDLIIKHRMAAPDPPWISGSWKPAYYNTKYQDLWARNRENPRIRSTSIPSTAKRDASCHERESTVPIVPDNCGVYGTFYVDLSGNGLKTFNSPGRCPKMHHPNPHQPGAETICISTKPPVKTPSPGTYEALPWKHAVRSQPKMGVLRDSWEKNHNKQVVHAVNSVPLVPTRNQAYPSNAYQQRFSHLPPKQLGGHLECVKLVGSPRLLQYSASLQLVDMLPNPPPLPIDETTDTHSLTSDEGSSRSTKLTIDMGSRQSLCAMSGQRGQPGPHNTNTGPSYSCLSTASYCMSLDEEQGAALTSQEVTQYLELSPKTKRPSVMPEQVPSLRRPFTPTMGYLCGALPSDHLEGTVADDQEGHPSGSQRGRFQSTPSSCYSEWDGSLWNSWGSVTEGNMTSARTSFISSVDSSSMSEANFARVLAVTAGSISGASLSDFSPPASPLSTIYSPFHGEGDSFGESEPMPAWDWNMAWMEEMEAQYKAQYPSQNIAAFDVEVGYNDWINTNRTSRR